MVGLVKFNTYKDLGKNKHVLRIFDVLMGVLWFSNKNALSMGGVLLVLSFCCCSDGLNFISGGQNKFH